MPFRRWLGCTSLAMGSLVLLLGGARAASLFSPNQELPLPLTAGSLPVHFIVRGLEPSVRVDTEGTIYVTSIRGVPGGFDMHRWSPKLDPPPNADGTLPFKYLGQPDDCGMLATGCNAIGIAEGGGDADIATGFPLSGLVPNLAVTSQTLLPGETSLRSGDRGETFTEPNPTGGDVPGEDREWMDGIGANTVFMAVHDLATFNINVVKSTDGGQTYTAGYGQAIDPSTMPVAGGVPATNSANVAGTFRVDRSSCSTNGNLYTIFVAPDSASENALGNPMRSVYVGVSKDAKFGLPVYTFTDHKVYTGPVGSSNVNLFPSLAVDRFGVVYAVWSDNTNIWFSRSTDAGLTWSSATRVNAGITVGNSNVFPWVDADASGHVVVAWFGGSRAGNSNDKSIHEPCAPGSSDCMKNWTAWQVYVSETVNGRSSSPAWVQFVASDHVIHSGTISTGGLGGAANRDLADYFQVALDPQHRPNLAFSDTHKVNPLGPDNGPDNPTTRRLIRANFTRKLETIAGVSTSGSCVSDPAVAATRVSAQGQVGNARFGLIAYLAPANGALSLDDLTANVKVRSSNESVTVTVSGSCVSYSSNAKVNDKPGYKAVVTACDGTPDGKADTMSVAVSGPNGINYSVKGAVTSGDVALVR
jgi:hypothetical protein